MGDIVKGRAILPNQQKGNGLSETTRAMLLQKRGLGDVLLWYDVGISTAEKRGQSVVADRLRKHREEFLNEVEKSHGKTPEER